MNEIHKLMSGIWIGGGMLIRCWMMRCSVWSGIVNCMTFLTIMGMFENAVFLLVCRDVGTHDRIVRMFKLLCGGEYD